jgi:hypothetical protein
MLCSFLLCYQLFDADVVQKCHWPFPPLLLFGCILKDVGGERELEDS